MKHIQKNQLAYWFMLYSSFSFAVMGALSRLTGEYYSWQLIAITRTGVAFLVSLLVVYVIKAELVFFKPKLLWLRSLSGSAGIISLFYAFPRIPLSDTLTLINTAPIWVILLNWMIFKQKPKIPVLIAIGLGSIGIFFIQQPHFQGEKFACVMALLNGFFTAISMLGLNRLQNVNPWSIVLHFSGVSTVVVFLLMLVNNDGIYLGTAVNSNIIFVCLFGVGIAGMLGQVFMTYAFAKGSTTKVSIIALSQIVFGLVFDSLFWNRQINLISVIGIILVVAPTTWILLKESPLIDKSVELKNVDMM